MKLKKLFKALKKSIIKNFQFKMKEPKGNLTRGEAFAQEKELYHEKVEETWSVFGDVTGFCYKEGIETKEAAQAYVDELNKNLENMKY